MTVNLVVPGALTQVPVTYAACKMEAAHYTLLNHMEYLMDNRVKAVCMACEQPIRHSNFTTHHGIVKKSDGIRVDDWWNLFVVCSEKCHRTLESKATFDALLQCHYLTISTYHLILQPPCKRTGYEWLQQQVDALDLRHQITLPLPEETL